jgi:hypothetical protein
VAVPIPPRRRFLPVSGEGQRQDEAPPVDLARGMVGQWDFSRDIGGTCIVDHRATLHGETATC